MPIVGMPDGTQVSFPDSMSPADIKSLIARKFPNDVRAGEASGWKSYIPRAIADIPSEIAAAAGENIDAIKQGFTNKADQGAIGGQVATGKGLLGVAGLIASPLTGAARSLIGHPLADTEHAIGSVIAPETAAKDNPEAMYQQAKSDTDLAMSALAPGRGGLRARGATPPAPPAPIPTGPLDVILSEGQTTRDLPKIQAEQAALRGTSGPAAQGRAQQFADQQAQQVAAAREKVATGLDPFGQRIAAGPQDAAELAQNSIQSAAASRKAGVDTAYKQARTLPGELDAGAFDGIADKIKSDLSSGPEPVVIDDKLTPYASVAIRDVENEIAKLKIQNRADPLGQPDQAQISGVSLRGVDQMRRRLTTFRSDAYKSGNGGDARAASAVVDAFDNHIDAAVNGGLFNGDPRAIQAWNDARAAHADYKSTFSAGKNDPVGRVVEKILGKGNNPAAIPNDVADFIYGSSGVNPNSLNVGVANRVRSILGPSSPEWSGVKQGLFSRLVETPEGVADLGPGKVTQRLNQFLNGSGKELAESMFSPQERTLMKQYADLNAALTIPQAGAGWSNTATFLAPLLKRATGRVTALLVAAIGHIPVVGRVAGPLVGAMADNMGGMVSNAKNLRQIAQQMPLITEAAQKFQRAVVAYNKMNSPPSRVALSVAASNMARAFKQINIDLALQSPATGRADEQQQVPRPPGQ